VKPGGELRPAEQRTLYRGPDESDWLFWNRTLGVSRSMRLRFEDRDFSLLMGGTIVADYDGSQEVRDDDFMNERFKLHHRMTYDRTPTRRICAALGPRGLHRHDAEGPHMRARVSRATLSRLAVYERSATAVHRGGLLIAPRVLGIDEWEAQAIDSRRRLWISTRGGDPADFPPADVSPEPPRPARELPRLPSFLGDE
jgi:hypothetical protein